jgi:hypothetical protein
MDGLERKNKMLAKLTREGWLELAVERLKPRFAEHGVKLPDNIRVTVGFTSRGGKKAIGQVWSDTASKGGFFEIFIHPSLEQEKALGVLVHELVHVGAGLKEGHGKGFKTLALKVGLTGKMRATEETEELLEHFRSLDLPEYPHFMLNSDAISSGPKKQGTRLIKAECSICGYNFRITQKWIDEAGLPDCPCCREPMTVAA